MSAILGPKARTPRGVTSFNAPPRGVPAKMLLLQSALARLAAMSTTAVATAPMASTWHARRRTANRRRIELRAIHWWIEVRLTNRRCSSATWAKSWTGHVGTRYATRNRCPTEPGLTREASLFGAAVHHLLCVLSEDLSLWSS